MKRNETNDRLIDIVEGFCIIVGVVFCLILCEQWENINKAITFWLGGN